MSIIIRDLSYVHSDKEVLFQHLNLVINPGDKMALTGNNGCGKSTLMRIIAGDLSATTGTVSPPGTSLLCASTFRAIWWPDHCTGFKDRWQTGSLTCHSERRCIWKTFHHTEWWLEYWRTCPSCLVGLGNGWSFPPPVWWTVKRGEKTRIFLAGLMHSPVAILLDEPTNHLDATGRQPVIWFRTAHSGHCTCYQPWPYSTKTVTCHLWISL